MTICYSKFSVTSLIRTNFHITTPQENPTRKFDASQVGSIRKNPTRVDSLGFVGFHPTLRRFLGFYGTPGPKLAMKFFAEKLGVYEK